MVIAEIHVASFLTRYEVVFPSRTALRRLVPCHPLPALICLPLSKPPPLAAASTQKAKANTT
jgi:hypothetical protein